MSEKRDKGRTSSTYKIQTHKPIMALSISSDMNACDQVCGH